MLAFIKLDCMRITVINITSKLNLNSVKDITKRIRRERTKRQWMKLLFSTLLVVGLVALAAISTSLLLRRAPFEFTDQQMSVDYLSQKQTVGQQKLLQDFGGDNPNVSPDGGTAFAYFTPDGQLPAENRLSAVLVTNTREEFDNNVQLFDQGVCTKKSDNVRGGAEYLELDCPQTDASNRTLAYGFFNGRNGIIFITVLDNDVLQDLMRNY